MSKFLSKEQIDFYNENGYLVVDNVLSNEQCDKTILQMERHADKDYAAILNPDRLEFLIAQSAEKISKTKELPDKVNYLSDSHYKSR